MKTCSCGSSAIIVTPNKHASGWGPSSYTYTCDKCGATVTGATIEETRKKWDSRMSQKQIRWQVSAVDKNGKETYTNLSSIEDVHLFIDTWYMGLDSIRIEKKIATKVR